MAPPSKSPPLLVRENGKLGRDIYAWSTSAIDGCGDAATDTCKQFCYAAKIQNRWKNVERSWAEKLALSLRPNLFKALMNAELAGLPDGAVVRCHVAGEWSTKEYARAWLEVMRQWPQITFYAYTRAWRLPDVRPVLERMRRLPNVTLWASTDEETGPAPRSWNKASYYKTIEDVPAHTIICPEQTASLTKEGRKKEVTCSSCRLCYVVRRDRPVRLAFIDHKELVRRKRT